MEKWARILATLAFGAGLSEAFDIRHSTGALRLSIWDDAYDRGLGAIAGLESGLGRNGSLGLQLGYSQFASKFDRQDVKEIEILLGVKREFHPSDEEFVYPRLGLHAGTSRNWGDSWHAVVGADAEGVIPVRGGWAVWLAFQPSYSVGEKNSAFWRVAAGFLFDARRDAKP